MQDYQRASIGPSKKSNWLWKPGKYYIFSSSSPPYLAANLGSLKMRYFYWIHFWEYQHFHLDEGIRLNIITEIQTLGTGKSKKKEWVYSALKDVTQQNPFKTMWPNHNFVLVPQIVQSCLQLIICTPSYSDVRSTTW